MVELLQTIAIIIGVIIGVAVLGFLLLLTAAMNAYWHSEEGQAKLDLKRTNKK
jgi:hypothetical protein